MSIFEFLMVLVSLIVGLGIAEVLTGVARDIRGHDSIRTYWVHSTFVAIVCLALLQQWWEIWGVRDASAWTFPGLILMLSGPIGLFLIAHLLFPETVENSDLRKYYYGQMQPVLWIGVVTVFLSVIFRPVIFGSELFKLDNLSSFIIMAVFIAMRLTQKPWFHGAMVTLVFFGLLADVLLVNIELS